MCIAWRMWCSEMLAHVNQQVLVGLPWLMWCVAAPRAVAPAVIQPHIISNPQRMVSFYPSCEILLVYVSHACVCVITHCVHVAMQP